MYLISFHEPVLPSRMIFSFVFLGSSVQRKTAQNSPTSEHPMLEMFTEHEVKEKLNALYESGQVHRLQSDNHYTSSMTKEF